MALRYTPTLKNHAAASAVTDLVIGPILDQFSVFSLQLSVTGVVMYASLFVVSGLKG